MSDGSANATRDQLLKERAAQVVLEYRKVDWDAVVAGDGEAVAQLVLANRQHLEVNELLDDGGDLGEKLRAGLQRFHATEVLGHLGDPRVAWQLATAGRRVVESDAPAAPAGLDPRSRPNVTTGQTVRMNTGCGNLYVTINEDEEGRAFELFNHMGKAGGCAASQNEAIGRLISYALRCGAKIEPLLKQLKGISCHRPAWSEDGKISSCSDAIGKALEKYLLAREQRGLPPVSEIEAPPLAGTGRNGAAKKAAARRPGAAVAKAPAPMPAPRAARRGAEDGVHKVQGACLECGGQLAFEEGCVKCYSCGFTECG